VFFLQVIYKNISRTENSVYYWKLTSVVNTLFCFWHS